MENRAQTKEGTKNREKETGSPDKAKWELGWQAPDNMLRITVFDQQQSSTKRKGASEYLRQKVLRMDAAMSLSNATGSQKRSNSEPISLGKKSAGQRLDLFRGIVKSVMLLLRCFRMRRKIAIQSDDLTFTHHERAVGLSSPERSSLSLELRMIFSTPPELRKSEDIHKVVSFLRVCGVIRAMLGQSMSEGDEQLARCAAYERYENGRVLAQQGHSPDRFYFVMAGKILVVKEYHVSNSVISKTVSVLTKGSTTSVEEMESESERKQSLICRGIVEVIAVDRDSFFAVRSNKTSGAKDYLAKHRLFCLFPTHLLNERSNSHLQYYPAGTVVFAGGQKYDWIYIIKSGECALVRTQMVTNVFCQKKSLFNKQTPEELGCDRGKRTHSSLKPLADFRVWKRRPEKSISTNGLTSRSMRNISSIKSNVSLDSEMERYSTRESFLTKPAENTILQIEDNLRETTLPSIAKFGDHEKRSERKSTSQFRGINPMDAAMAGINRSSTESENRSPVRLMLSGSRMSASVSRELQRGVRHHDVSNRSRVISSAPPGLRRAHLELGRLKSGDVFGLDDLYDATEDVTKIALLSNGADVVKIKRSFFLRHAPTNLRMQLSGVNHDFPSISEARRSLEASETWTMYKMALLRLLTADRKSLNKSTIPPRAAKYTRNRIEQNGGRHAVFPANLRSVERLQPPAQRGANDFSYAAVVRHPASAPSLEKSRQHFLNGSFNPRVVALKSGAR